MVEVQCRSDIPNPDINLVVIIDGGIGNQPTIQFVNDMSDNGNCPETITRTYSATDDCGNIVYCSQIIVVNDTIKPEINTIANYNIDECNAQWPGELITTWTDNCSKGGDLISDTGIDDGMSEDGCFQHRLYTFTVTDDCGNSTTKTTRVGKWFDETPPVITGIPDYQLEGCNAQWPEFLSTTWMDNCSSGGAISVGGVEDGVSADGCTQYRLYTFNVVDNCGNMATETTRVSRIFDITNPDIVDVPDYILDETISDWPNYLTTTWTDNCSNGGSLNSDGGVDDGRSVDGQVLYRLYTFIVTDDCGNTETETTRIGKGSGSAGPGIHDIPDFTLSGCNTDWPIYLNTTWTDNCSGGGSLDSDGGVDDGQSADGCIQYRLYTFTLTDGCGNTDTATTRVARAYDMTDPNITDIPDYTLEGCNAEWPEYLTSIWTDNCSGGGSLDSDGGVDDGQSTDGCIQYRLYTFTVTDGCGNTDTATTRVARAYDMTDPNITGIPDYTLEGCNAEWPQYLTTSWTDNCSGGGSLDSDGGVDDGQSADGCIQYRLYTFTVTDGCGNADTKTTKVAKGNSADIEDLADYQLESCNEEWPEYLMTNWTNSCAEGGEIQSDPGVEDGTSEDGCMQYRLYTFTFANCGDTETTRVSRLFDVTNPEIVDITDFQLQGCDTEWPQYLSTIWTDNCSAGGAIDSESGVDDGTSADGTIEFRLYAFTITDDCGNIDMETTRVSKTLGSGTELIQGATEDICRKDFPAPNGYDLTNLLLDNTDSGGVWSLHTSPNNVAVPINQNGSVITTDLPSGDYVFRYTLVGNTCNQIIEVGITVLPPDQEPCILPCASGEISTAMTPNADTVNDTFHAGIAAGGSCTVDVQIFNRWGDKVFEAQNYKNDWGGAVQSNAFGSASKITTGTYYYILKYKLNGNVEQTITGYFYVATD